MCATPSCLTLLEREASPLSALGSFVATHPNPSQIHRNECGTHVGNELQLVHLLEAFICFARRSSDEVTAVKLCGLILRFTNAQNKGGKIPASQRQPGLPRPKSQTYPRQHSMLLIFCHQSLKQVDRLLTTMFIRQNLEGFS
jgi:hypothetical protein